MAIPNLFNQTGLSLGQRRPTALSIGPPKMNYDTRRNHPREASNEAASEKSDVEDTFEGVQGDLSWVALPQFF
jgi:hypothetical protein